jgi:hypothetical protein
VFGCAGFQQFSMLVVLAHICQRRSIHKACVWSDRL